MKKLISVVLVLIITVSSVISYPISAEASESGSGYITMEAYNDSPSSQSGSAEVSNEKLKSVSWISETVPLLRDALSVRKEYFYFRIPGEKKEKNEIEIEVETLIQLAQSDEISQTSIDGDYISNSFSGAQYEWDYDYSTNEYTAEIKLFYYDTAAQEKEVDAAVENFFSSIDLNNISDYDLVHEIYDYVMSSCEYNYDDINAKYNFSAYGALVKGKAVCQGYAVAFYRLCKEAGLDARVISSDPYEGCHAWNMVRLGDKYYFTDCTWDDAFDNGAYDYFFLVDYDDLRFMDTNNNEHKIYEEEFDNDYFNNNYRCYFADESWSAGSQDISNCTISYDADFDPDSVTVSKSDGTLLTEGEDYEVLYDDTDYMLSIVGKGDYTGHSERKCRINGKSLSVTESCVYSGYDQEPSVSIDSLERDVDYAVIYSDNSDSGTALAAAYGTGKYTGYTSQNFTIEKADINNFNINLSFTEKYYNGSVQKPQVTVDNISSDDYTVSYQAISEPGTGYVYITGQENCYGTAVREYKIVKYDITSREISISKTEYNYTGLEIKPAVFVNGCVEGTDYDVEYSSNINPGTASVTITGKGHFTGSKTLYFTIKTAASSSKTSSSTKVSKPKKVTLKKLKTSKKSITVYWKKVSASGYQIQYSTSKNFKKSKKITVKSSKKTSYKIKKLKKGKKYYVRIRAYKTVNGKKVYGKWSSKKSITCK